MAPLNPLSPGLNKDQEIEGKGKAIALLPYINDAAAVKSYIAKIAEPTTAGGCAPWTAGLVKGYGVFWVGGRTVRAHRFGWVLHHKIEIPSNREIGHRCNVRCCQLLAHLELIDHPGNMKAVAGPMSDADSYKRVRAHWHGPPPRRFPSMRACHF